MEYGGTPFFMPKNELIITKAIGYFNPLFMAAFVFLTSFVSKYKYFDMKNLLKTMIMSATFALGVTNIQAQSPDSFNHMISAAIKAPSGHNTQPWKFKLGNDCIDVMPDFTKSLSAVDGTNRELYISLGTATENLCIAASHEGYTAKTEIMQNNEKAYYVHVSFAKSSTANTSPLYDAIYKRQTNRSVYNKSIIGPDTITLLKQIVPEQGTHIYMFPKGSTTFNDLATKVYKGNELQMNDPLFKKELLEWIRFNKSQAKKEGNGLTSATMGAPNVPEFMGKPIVKAFLNPKAQNKGDMKKIESSSHLVLITSTEQDPKAWISVGRTLERFILNTTNLGIANAYMNQPCEIKELSNKIKNELPAINQEYPNLLLRVGYSKPMPYSPRQNIDSFIIK